MSRKRLAAGVCDCRWTAAGQNSGDAQSACARLVAWARNRRRFGGESTCRERQCRSGPAESLKSTAGTRLPRPHASEAGAIGFFLGGGCSGQDHKIILFFETGCPPFLLIMHRMAETLCEDRRRAVRSDVSVSATIARPNASPIHCEVRNVSADGACIYAPNVWLPPIFVLELHEARPTERICRRIWRANSLIGVRFLNARLARAGREGPATFAPS
jgi:PilZ domain-containing protein